jgi:hypothetical protein
MISDHTGMMPRSDFTNVNTLIAPQAAVLWAQASRTASVGGMWSVGGTVGKR